VTRRAWLALLTLLGLRRPARTEAQRLHANAVRVGVPTCITDLQRGDIVYPSHQADTAAQASGAHYVVRRYMPWVEVGRHYPGGPMWRRRAVARYCMGPPYRHGQAMPLIDWTLHLEADRGA